MTYLNIKGKSQRLFEKNLFENLSQAYNARKGKTIFDYERHEGGIMQQFLSQPIGKRLIAIIRY